MIVLDTDTLTLFFRNHPRVIERFQEVSEDVAITIISRIETLQGRFASLMKAADGDELRRGQLRLNEAEGDLARIPLVLPINATAAAEFDRLRQNKKLRKIGRGDLLIAAVTLANRATLITRNLRDFRQVPGLSVENWAD
jgi:tRNA(fMet)-specific endonuclease VapC